MKKILYCIVLIIFIGLTLFLSGKVYFTGNESEKEEILSATIWKLSEEGYSENDIKSIDVKYNPLKGGSLPYNVFVVFEKKSSEAQIYSWSNTEKIKVENIGVTTP